LFLHLLDVHLIGEVVAISLFKNLPRKHPVYRLLEPVCTVRLQSIPNWVRI
jgi:hypothetical protein